MSRKLTKITFIAIDVFSFAAFVAQTAVVASMARAGKGHDIISDAVDAIAQSDADIFVSLAFGLAVGLYISKYVIINKSSVANMSRLKLQFIIPTAIFICFFLYFACIFTLARMI